MLTKSVTRRSLPPEAPITATVLLLAAEVEKDLPKERPNRENMITECYFYSSNQLSI